MKIIIQYMSYVKSQDYIIKLTLTICAMCGYLAMIFNLMSDNEY